MSQIRRRLPILHGQEMENAMVAYKNLRIQSGGMQPMSKLKKLDRIEVTIQPDGNIRLLDDMQMEACRAMPAIASMPFLEEGVIKMSVHPDLDRFRGVRAPWIYFRLGKVDMDACTFSVFYEAYADCGNDTPIYVKDLSWEVDITAPGTMEEGCSMSIREIKTQGEAMEEIEQSGGYRDYMGEPLWHALRASIQDVQEGIDSELLCQDYVKGASAVFSQLSCLMLLESGASAPKETAGTEKQITTPAKPAGKRKTAGISDKPKTIYIGGTKITLQHGTTAKVKGHRIQNRYTMSWSVRGHFRHYKKGPKWIQPYQKGPGRKTVPNGQQKIYKVKPEEP